MQPIMRGVVSPPVFVPNAVDWPNASAFTDVTTTFVRFTGITTSITVSVTHPLNPPISVHAIIGPNASLLGATLIECIPGTTAFTVPPNYYVAFNANDTSAVTGCVPTTFTVRDVSGGGVILDTFTIEILTEA
jgi:hypothetical protein